MTEHRHYMEAGITDLPALLRKLASMLDDDKDLTPVPDAALVAFLVRDMLNDTLARWNEAYPMKQTRI